MIPKPMWPCATPIRRFWRRCLLASTLALALAPPAAGAGPAAPADAHESRSTARHPAAASGVPAEPGAFELRDDWQRAVRLPGVPARIVSMAPHSTELLFAVGAGARVVAVDPASDLPPEVRTLPKVATLPRPDPERLLALRPDLIVIWGAGASRELIDRLEALGIPVFVSEPRRLDDVATTLERFARLTGTPRIGVDLAREFRVRLDELRRRHSGQPTVPVFVQIWSRPLMTLSDHDSLADALSLCGASNVFGDAPVAAPQVGVEAVVRRAPRMIIGFAGKTGDGGHEPWQRLGMLEPRGPFAHVVISDAIQRPTLGVLGPLARLCEAVDAVRGSVPMPGAAVGAGLTSVGAHSTIGK